MCLMHRVCGRAQASTDGPPPPSSARTARPLVPITHGVEHGEPAAESAVVGLAGTVGGEQRCRTACLEGFRARCEV